MGLLLAAGTGGAHPLAPALLELRERGDGRVEVLFKTSSTRLPGVERVPVLPDTCLPVGAPRAELAAGHVLERSIFDCGPGGLVGARIGVWGLETSRTDALLRVELADGRRVQAVLRAGASHHVVPERASKVAVARDYGVLGVAHIATGLDHLLFVFGLLLLVGGAVRGVVKTVTAFTVGHSLTLSLAALGAVRLPPAPTELLIAASVFLLAVELAREPDDAKSGIGRRPWWVAGAFGLLHGLGFAGALAQVGLPDEEIAVALLGFNLGIEAGQLGFVLAVLLAGRAMNRLPFALSGWARLVPVYVLGTLAAYGLIQRAAEALS